MTLSDLDQKHILAHTPGLWHELRGRRLFITGGTGFYGCWLLESLLLANASLGLNCSAVVLTRNPAAFAAKAPHLAASPAIRLHAGDVATFVFPEGSFSHIIHAADMLSQAAIRNPAAAIDAAYLGTRRVLEFARLSGVRKLLLTSSGAVYGPTVAGRTLLREDDGVSAMPLEPRGAYAEGKRLGEMLCTLWGQEHGFEIKIARGFAFIGPYLPVDAHLAAGDFIRDALQGGPVIVKGRGAATRSYLYGADLAIWLWTILLRGAPNRPYNVGSDEPISIAGLATAVAHACELHLAVKILGCAAAGSPPDDYVPDISRARMELGLEAWVRLPEAICRTLCWHREAACAPTPAANLPSHL